MQQPGDICRRDNGFAFEYAPEGSKARHEAPAPVENAVENPPHGEESPVWYSEEATPDYKPTALRWPFFGVVIGLLLATMVLVIVADTLMPDLGGGAAMMAVTRNETQPAQVVNYINTTVIHRTVQSTSLGIISSRETSSTSIPARSSRWTDGAWVVAISTSVFRFTTNITLPLFTITFTSAFTSTRTVPFTSTTVFPITATTLTTIPSASLSTIYSVLPTNSTGNGTASQSSTAVSTITIVTQAATTSRVTFTSSVASAVVGVLTQTSTGTVTNTSTITGMVIPTSGESTVTYYIKVPVTTHTSTQTPSPTATNPSTDTNSSTTTDSSTQRDAYIFLGAFLPPLLCIPPFILLRIIDLNAKLYQPFQTLTANAPALTAGTSSSAPPPQTLLLQYTGLYNSWLLPVVTSLFPSLVTQSESSSSTAASSATCTPDRQAIPFFTTLAVLLASFLTPLATEAIGLRLQLLNNPDDDGVNRALTLGVKRQAAYALIAVLAALMILVSVVAWVVVGGRKNDKKKKWVTGVSADPWCIAGMAALLTHGGGDGVRRVLGRVSTEQGMKMAVMGGGKARYALGWSRGGYGVVFVDEGFRREDVEETTREAATWGGRKHQTPFMVLGYPWRVSVMALHLLILVFIVYYHAKDGRLRLVLNTNNTFGIRFIAALVGVILAFCWQAFFLGVNSMIPYHLLAQHTQPASSSILLTRCTNPFSGFLSALRHNQPFPLAVSLATIASEFLPVLLPNIRFPFPIPISPPATLSQTATPPLAPTVSAILAGIFLTGMLAVLASSFAVRYPPMPVDPRSVAGAMWYVARSGMVIGERVGGGEGWAFEGVLRMGGGERRERIEGMGRRYFYGILLDGDGGGRRLGVDWDVGEEGDVVG
ncbi:hypothetical protein B0J18DRAFT_433792 [Chaetomium sp. MPI-SDFR-AT-0129]|nr:hypothetical protein B0J18DRAFT_433792 [Chaetomium sp. MPI-SDFR-AT-0129]